MRSHRQYPGKFTCCDIRTPYEVPRRVTVWEMIVYAILLGMATLIGVVFALTLLFGPP